MEASVLIVVVVMVVWAGAVAWLLRPRRSSQDAWLDAMDALGAAMRRVHDERRQKEQG